MKKVTLGERAATVSFAVKSESTVAKVANRQFVSTKTGENSADIEGGDIVASNDKL